MSLKTGLLLKLNCTGYLICQSSGHCQLDWIRESIYRKWNFQHVRWKGSDLNKVWMTAPFCFHPTVFVLILTFMHHMRCFTSRVHTTRLILTCLHVSSVAAYLPSYRVCCTGPPPCPFSTSWAIHCAVTACSSEPAPTVGCQDLTQAFTLTCLIPTLHWWRQKRIINYN